jgi:hypothetical protein
MNSNKKKKPRKQNSCSKCGRFTRGHVGPPGRNCGMDKAPIATKPIVKKLEQPVKKLEQPDFDGQSASSSSGCDTVLLELSSQLGKLSLGMQKMQTDIAELKTVKAEGGVGANAGLAVKSPDKIEESSKSSNDTFECHFFYSSQYGFREGHSTELAAL